MRRVMTDVTIMGKAEDHPKIHALEKRLPTKAASHFLALGLTDPELSIVLTDDAHIQTLNAEWRGEDKATDVLSFPLWSREEYHDGVPALGDVIISVEYAERLVAGPSHRKRVADSLGVPESDLRWGLEEEVDFLLIHGLLHLIGHDHAEPD